MRGAAGGKRAWLLPAMKARLLLAMLERSNRTTRREDRAVWMTVTMSSRTWLAGHLRERGLTCAGIGYATFRLALEQLFGRAVGQLGRDAASLLDWVQVDRLHLVVCVGGGLAVLAGAVADVWPSGPVGSIGMLVLPVGGPAWAGLLPVGATYKGFRGVVQAVVTIPATCNAVRLSTCKAGPVTLSVLIVDDSAPFREVARRLLERQGLEVVGTAATSAEAVAQVETLHPHVALVDINLAGESGFEVARQLVRSDLAAGTAVVLTSTHAESEYADLLAVSPAVGFVAKERLSAEAIRTALSAPAAE